MKKRFLAFLIMAVLVITMCPMNAFEADAATSYTTKASVEKRIKTLNTEISKLSKTYKTQLSKQKQQKRGTEAIYGDIKCYNPFIVKQAFSLGTYYWITNSDKLENSFLLATGYAKPTGEYREWNGITCTVAKAVHVSKAANKTKKKLNSKKSELKKLKKSLTDIPKISKKISNLAVGDSYNLSAYMKGGTGKYNKISWSSSDVNVCTVKNGKLTGVSPGTCTIKVKSSVSKKVDTLKISVVENNGEPMQYGDHEIILSESNIVFDNPTSIDVEIKTGEDLQEIGYKLCDINGNEVESGVCSELSEWDGDTIFLSIWPDPEYTDYGQYKIIVYETGYPSNCKTINIIVEENASFSG